MSDAQGNSSRDAFARMIGEVRPKLHRYCARMTGSAIDGEDVVQEAIAKAIEADRGQIENLEGWLFRIAHNAALDHLRRKARQEAGRSDEVLDMIADTASEIDRRIAAEAGLRTFMHLPAAQRSSIILMDVLGLSLDEIHGVTDMTVPAIKASLHRGRTRLREIARRGEDAPQPVLNEPERSLLAAYIDRFNARDFDAVRDMLADEVRLELVNKTRLKGREVNSYFGNYSNVHDWHFVAGFVDRRPAVLVRRPDDASARPAYFILLEWTGDSVAAIRDYRHARYVADDAEMIEMAR